MGNPAAREAQRIQSNREEMIELIARAVPVDGHASPFAELALFRISKPLGVVHSVAKPSFCVIAQGSKQIMLGDSVYRYDPDHYLITTIEMPRSSCLLEATPELPYLGLRLDLDPTLVNDVLVSAGQTELSLPCDVRALDVSPLDLALQDAVLRMLRLLDTPNEMPVMLPIIQREIVYRLITGAQGMRLRHMATQAGLTPLIARAVERLRAEYDQPLRMENLARDLGISVSGLHHHFKAVTAISPLQFQKQLRLQEARRLMLSEDLDASSAAFRVGYNDASHFNREYKSLFGVPPMRDVQRLKDTTLRTAEH